MAARSRPHPSPRLPAAAAPPARSGPAWAAALAVALAALVTYANSLGNGFVWDDPIILERQLVAFRGIGDVLAPPRDIPQFSPDYYRPVTIASYLFDRAVGGERPVVFHLSLVLTHAAAALLLWALAAQLLADRRGGHVGALAAGLLFAVHPIHSESVAWVAGRSDVLATAFLLAALVLHGRMPWSWRGGLASGVAAAGALGAKEAGVALYPLLFLRDLLLAPARRSLGTWLRGYAGVAVAGLVYILLRRHALGEFVGTAPGITPAPRPLLEIAAAVGVYVGKLLWPWPLNAYIDQIAVGPLSLGLAALFVAALAAAAWRWRAGGDALPLFALAWVGLTLTPSLAILWKIPDAPLAERYLYLPSAGLCLLVGALAAQAWAGAASALARTALAGGAAAVLGAAVLATAARNPVWRDDVALWVDTEAHSQVSGMAARNLGTAYQKAGRITEARAAFARALALRNDPGGLQTIHTNLGTLALLDGDYAAARAAYERALAATPDAPDTLFNLGLVVLQGGGSTPDAARAALPHFERAGQLNPHDADFETALAQAYLILGERQRGCEHLRRAQILRPSERTAAGIQQLLADCP